MLSGCVKEGGKLWTKGRERDVDGVSRSSCDCGERDFNRRSKRRTIGRDGTIGKTVELIYEYRTVEEESIIPPW
jgi:hypothetical protein